MNWEDIRYFIAVARTQNLSEVARQRAVSTSTVSRRLSSLQQSLGAQLFVRRQEGFELTETGRALLSAAEAAEAHLSWFERAAEDEMTKVSGRVRVATPELLGEHVIVPELGALARKYPELRIELQTDVRPSRLSKREADILIRLTRPTQGDYTIRRIGQVALGLYGTKQYLQYYGEPQLFTQLTGHRLIGWNKELGYLPLAYWLEGEIDTQQVQLRTANLASQLIAASSHQGLAVLPRFAAEKAGLRRVLCDESWLKMDIWMLQQTASRQLARVRVVSDFLTEVIQAARPQLDSPQ